LENAVTAQTVTLIAALIAAIAAVCGAILSSSTARRVAKESALATQYREDRAFRRQRIAAMKDILFENAIALRALSGYCHSVPWLTKTPLEEIHEKGIMHIARIEYAVEILRTMGESILDDESTLAGLPSLFASYCGWISNYKEQIDIGNIEPTGNAKPPAKEIEKGFLSESRNWDRRIGTMREIIAQVCSATEHNP
jgi:hypothetical protein